MANALSSFDQSKEPFECGSFVMGHRDNRIADENQALAKGMVVSVYNRLRFKAGNCETSLSLLLKQRRPLNLCHE